MGCPSAVAAGGATPSAVKVQRDDTGFHLLRDGRPYLIKGGGGTRVYYTRQSGYDTHSAQLGTHANLLGELAGAMQAFLDDLAAARLADRVVLMTFSEFGRTVQENGSAGTDHGTAGPVLVAGRPVQPGLVGKTPSLLELDAKHGDLKMGLDFRQVYATLLDRWLEVPSEAVLGRAYDRLRFLGG